VTFSRTTATPKEGLYQVVVQYTVEQVGRLAIGYAQELLQAALNNTDFSLAKAIATLREVDEDLRLGPSTASIVNAGLNRNIPFIRLTEGSLVQLGWGSKQRRIQAAETDASSAIECCCLTSKSTHAFGLGIWDKVIVGGNGNRSENVARSKSLR
jgi:cyanophycin synthetase